MRRVLLLALILAACSGNDPEKQAKSAKSWHTTIDVVATAMHAHKVSPRYAKQVAEVAEKDLEKNSSGKDALEAARKLRDECERR